MRNQKLRARGVVTLAVAVAVSLLLSACTASADANTDGRAQVETSIGADIADRLDAALAEAVELSGSSAAIAGVWTPWAGGWAEAPGTVTVDGSAFLSTGMRYRIGTNTTAMTCTVLLKLVDEGRVKLDDTLSTYLKHAPAVGDITLGQLCQNTSALADFYSELSPQFVNNPTRVWPPLEVVSSGLGATHRAKPGTWAQSSTGIVLLGMALEAATGHDWASLYQKYIFGPLGMNHTSFPASDRLEIPGLHPHGYATALDQRGKLLCESVLDETALSNSMTGVAGGVVSTVDDMRKWTQALATGSLLTEKSVDAQWATVPLGAKAPSWQGYGLGVKQLGPMRGLDGEIPGFISASFADPSSGLTVVVMLNNSSAGSEFAGALARRLASIASKAPALPEQKRPLVELPWSEKQTVQTMQDAAVCQPPAAE